MDINLEDHQLALAEVADDFFAARSPMGDVRELEESELGYSPTVWAEIAALDWLRLGHPAADGGIDGGLLDLSVIYQAMGRTLYSSPHLDSAVISGGLLRRSNAASARELLAQVLAGDTIVVPALAEDDGGFGPESIALSGRALDGGWQLDGTKLFVAYANSASHVIVAARTSPVDGDGGGVTLAIVATSDPGVTLTRLPNLSGLPLFAVTLDSVTVAADAIIGEPGQGWQLLEPIMDQAAVLRSAQIAGASDRLLAMSTEYANQRTQFGKAIGSNQAVQYLCSDIAINGHLTLLHARYAAGLIDAGLPATKAASEAKAAANHTARLAPERAHAVYAGIGFMLEFDLQLYTRRCRYWELDAGDDDYHRKRIATALAA
jgi:alkylation response protein AidB-like acyl-CoA dehydrogenase